MGFKTDLNKYAPAFDVEENRTSESFQTNPAVQSTISPSACMNCAFQTYHYISIILLNMQVCKFQVFKWENSFAHVMH